MKDDLKSIHRWVLENLSQDLNENELESMVKFILEHMPNTSYDVGYNDGFEDGYNTALREAEN